MDFPSNAFTVQGQGAYNNYVVLRAKDSQEKLSRSSKNCESLALQNFPCLQYITILTMTVVTMVTACTIDKCPMREKGMAICTICSIGVYVNPIT